MKVKEALEIMKTWDEENEIVVTVFDTLKREVFSYEPDMVGYDGSPGYDEIRLGKLVIIQEV